MFDILQLNEKLLPELKEIAKKLKIENYESLKKQDLVYKILDHQALNPEIDFKKLGIDSPSIEKPAKEVRMKKTPEKTEKPVKTEKVEKTRPEKVEVQEKKETASAPVASNDAGNKPSFIKYQ